MSDRLEQFVRDHRDEFDTEEPDNRIWEQISRDMDPDKKKQPPVVQIPIRWIKWSAAAAVLLLIAGATWYFTKGKSMPQFDLAHQANPKDQPNANNATNTNPANSAGANPADTSAKNTHNLAQTPAGVGPTADSPTLASIRPDNFTGTGSGNLAGNRPGNKDNSKGNQELESSVSEEMYHYARLVEIRHKELKSIEKDEPLLYKQFALDVDKLDSVYHSLQAQLPKNPNREQLLEAMLQNLQLQMELLNHQLEIIKQINHSKKSEYEKAYKTV